MDAFDDHIQAGRKHGLAVLDARMAEYGEQEAKAMAAGLICGVRNWFIIKYGRRSTFNLMFAVADDIITPELKISPVDTHLPTREQGRDRA